MEDNFYQLLFIKCLQSTKDSRETIGAQQYYKILLFSEMKQKYAHIREYKCADVSL